MPWRVPFGTSRYIHSESRSKLVNISHFDGNECSIFSAASLASTGAFLFRATLGYCPIPFAGFTFDTKGNLYASATIGEI